MSATADRNATFLTSVRAVAETVAAPLADEVDRDARFPREAVDALREQAALSCYVPPSHGGDGVGFAELAAACFELARGCAATGMVFAMHQIQVACITRHGIGTPFFDEYLEELVAGQRLIASATSEVGVGGDLRSSIAAVTPDGDAVQLEKNAPTVSYGEHADDLLITARRSPEADRGDQVLVLTRGDEASLEQTGSWDALGMRGTCSPSFIVRARVAPEQCLPIAFAEIAAETMVPFSHILWAHVWLGIATGAYDRARAFVRAQAKSAPGAVPPTASRLSALAAELHAMRSEVAAATDEYAALIESDAGSDDLLSVGYAIRINALKINASERAPRICSAALGICGMPGYKNDTPFSIGRHLRDALSAALMIANDRIHATNAALLLVHKAG
ncbi:MAG TPA: acyl-CoA dehydrogenase family protein [Gaiella sp.]